MAALKITPLHPALGRRDRRRRSGQAGRRTDPAGAVAGARRPSGTGVSRPVADAAAVSRRRRRRSDRRWSSTTRQHNMPDFPLIGLIWHRNGQQPAERWHTDHTNRERPPAATILYGVEIPSAGGGTSVASMRAAYTALPADERRRLDGLTTFNSLDSGRTDTRAGGPRRSTASRSSTRWCAPTPCTARARCTSTSRRPRTSTA